MTNLSELISQRDELNKKIAEQQKIEFDNAIAQIKTMMDSFGITVSDLAGKHQVTKSKNKVAAKYRDPVTGSEWTGRGLTPTWLRDKDKSKYLIS